MKPTVYLAGPITGSNYDECVNWRELMGADLAESGIMAFSPMRHKEYLGGIAARLTADGDKYAEFGTLSTNRGITTRDRFDATHCDLLFVNVLGAKTPSIGTIMEIAWADAHRIPIVCAMEPEGNPHHHGMVLEVVGFRVHTLEEAAHVIKSVLLPSHSVRDALRGAA